tara:strand:+ start:419 stop:775 length:357 start_codon:yes stop_codon:yes gene_type:complete
VKVCLVLDTEDYDGMCSTLKIFKMLAREQGMISSSGLNDVSFGQIELIQLLRDFAAFSEVVGKKSVDANGNGFVTLKHYKEFIDRCFKVKNENFGIPGEGYPKYVSKWWGHLDVVKGK